MSIDIVTVNHYNNISIMNNFTVSGNKNRILQDAVSMDEKGVSV